jgi:hypothetical protein
VRLRRTFFLSPKTFSEEAAFAPVPWALSAYLVFTIVRLLLAHGRRLPRWFVYASIVADMGLLMGLVWSFHVQYEQPVSFYLKVPTLLYVFIIISLRALRFEVRYELLSGLAVAIARGRTLLIRSVAESVAAKDLATFNIPEQLDNHAACALQAALEAQSILEGRTFGDGIKLKSRVGINSGVIVGGLVGTDDRLGYTVHGDEVNLAARLEQLNKEYGTHVIVSEHTRQLAGEERFAFQRMGEVTVRGRKNR